MSSQPTPGQQADGPQPQDLLGSNGSADPTVSPTPAGHPHQVARPGPAPGHTPSPSSQTSLLLVLGRAPVPLNVTRRSPWPCLGTRLDLELTGPSALRPPRQLALLVASEDLSYAPARVVVFGRQRHLLNTELSR